MADLPHGVRDMFAEEVEDMPWVCTEAGHGSRAHKHVGILRRWFYKPASPVAAADDQDTTH